METYVCKYCGRVCKNDNSLRNHERLCKNNPDRQVLKSNFINYNKKRTTGEIITWNKGLTKDTDERVLKYSKTLKDGYKSGRIKHGVLSEEGLRKIKEGASKCGGYKEKCGRGKHGWYKGIWCDSSWELAFVIYHLEHNLYIERCHDIRVYEYDNKTYKYFPDFITDDGVYEIKGYYSDKSKSKHLQHPDIKMIFSEDMKIYLDYVIEKYGRNFIRLYD